MSTSERERILSSVEMALGFPPRDEDLLAPKDRREAPPWLNSRDPWDMVQKELEGLSARFHRAKDVEDARSVIRSVLAEHSVQRAVHWEHPLLTALHIEEILSESNVTVISPEEGKNFAQESAQADIGITAAECVISESGAIMVKAQKGRERSSSLLPPIHLAVISPEQRLQSVFDLVPLWRKWLREEGKLPSGIHIITGPSRTADIELTIVLGAHGPKVLHVLALEPGCLPEP